MGIQQVNKHYRVPGKRGLRIRYPHITRKADTGLEGRILSAESGSYFNIRLSNGERLTVHPFELDYWSVDGWVCGRDLKERYDAAWDRFNRDMGITSR